MAAQSWRAQIQLLHLAGELLVRISIDLKKAWRFWRFGGDMRYGKRCCCTGIFNGAFMRTRGKIASR